MQLKNNGLLLGDDHVEGMGKVFSLQQYLKFDSKNKQITHLNLSENRLGNKGAKVLFDCLPPSLKSLDLSKNPGLGIDGYKCLEKGLGKIKL